MNDYDMARQLAQVLLKNEQTPTREIIQEKVRAVLAMLGSQAGRAVEVHEEKLVRDLESLFNVWIGACTILDNQEDHIPWLADRRSEITWDFWNRYVRYLEEEEGWAPATLNSIDQLTDEILERIEDPKRQGAWDRRGMVVGQVQSGKTANYTSLICKAVDAGYKLIIVLTGLTDSLRSQTQIRLDEGFLGFDSQVYRAFDEKKNSFVGAGKITTGKWLIANSATSSDQKGDFNRKVANQFGVLPGGDPLLLVIKKNKSVLNNLFNWALSVRGVMDAASGRRIVRGVPLLVIDDEADNASIDTNPLIFDENGIPLEDHDPTKINALIRRLLHSFEQSAYVAYTATPFANIFIHPNGSIPSCGDDLFPRSFIINLPTPSNYIGPSKVFGLDADPTISLDEVESLPIIRAVDDAQEWMPDKHKKDHIPCELPQSLKEAIRAFILSCAIRMVRGQEKKHNSMLVHVTLLTDVQEKVAEQVQDELAFLRRRLRYSDGNASCQVLEEFKHLWQEDFRPTTRSIAQFEPQLVPWDDVRHISWQEVKPLLYEAASKIQVKKINGTARDVLDYEEHDKNGLGLYVIAIGGNKLSRGLTLEGLTVSYYLRTSKMYDTLMQMGRWFGYRPGYLDLCRLYTTDDLMERYEHIAVASEELRQEFDRMAYERATPNEFGLKVRTHPDNLVIITATNKMRASTIVSLSYARSLSETTIFYKAEDINQKNFEATEELLVNLGAYSRIEKHNYIWERVPAEKIIEFLSGYKSHDKCPAANTALLVEYIKPRWGVNELISWTVILISKNKAKNIYSIASNNVGLTQRKNVSKFPQEYRVSKSHILSPTDEWLDLPAETRQEIMSETNAVREKKGEKTTSTPSGAILRSKRLSKNGLLLIYPLDPEEIINSKIPIVGFVISFPNSEINEQVEYRVNTTFLEQLDQV